MAADSLKALTFPTEPVNDSKLVNKENRICICRTSKRQAETGRKTPTTNSVQKENQEVEKAIVKKPKEQPKQPLACGNVQTSKKDGVSLAAEKTERPVTRSKSLKAVASSAQEKAPSKEGPKIIVYQDSADNAGEKKNKSGIGLSKSLDSERESERKNSRMTVPGRKKASTSFLDLTNIQSQNKKEKSMCECKKSPNKKEKSPILKKTALKSKQTKEKLRFKQGQAEFDQMVMKLESMFPNVDPVYLQSQFVKFNGSLSDVIEDLLIKEKTEALPSKSDYVRRLEAERLQNKFLENFSVENFLKMIPDPWEHFLKTEKHNSTSYLGHSLHYLKGKYKQHYLKAIHSALDKCGNSLYLADKELRKRNRLWKMRTTNRSKYECDAGRPTTFNIQFVHEVAFIENENQIKSYIKKKETDRFKKFKEAEKAGTLLKCQSCKDFTLLRDDAVNCPANHVFCKDCVVKCVKIEMEKNNFQFKCLMKCEARFSFKTLQTILSPFILANIINRNQREEIKTAGIEDLAFCPFCYYVAVVPPVVTVFKCENPSCMIESCRLCKQFNHIPLKCQEFEVFEEFEEFEAFDKTTVKLDIDVENGKEKDKDEKSIKCSDCNGDLFKCVDSALLLCICGAEFCSICRGPFLQCQHVDAATTPDGLSSSSADETHFSGNEGDSEGKNSGSFVEFLQSESDVF